MTHRPEFRARVLELYLAGKTYPQIERETGCSLGTIASFVYTARRADPAFPDRHVTAASRRVLKRMRAR